MDCKRCKINGVKMSHYIIQVYLYNGFPINLCDKHKNFKPNKFIVWLDHKWHVHYVFPKYYMQVFDLSYKQAKLKYYKLNIGKKINLGLL